MMTTIHVFATLPGNRTATHRKSHGYRVVGYRVVEEIDRARLTEAGRKLLDLMQRDLSGVLEHDDLTPRLVRRQITVGILEASELLGADQELAKRWADAYGAHAADGEEWYDIRFHRLGHDTTEDAINATAELPGIAVRLGAFGEPVPLNSYPLDAGPEHRLQQAKRWSHMLRVRAA